MAVKIRLARRGRKKRITFDVVVADARAPRDGRFIEKIGLYNPLTNPAHVEIKEDRAFHWLMNGAQPSYTVKAMLSYRGIMLKKHLQIGVMKGALTQEQADAKLAEWQKEKENKIKTKQEQIAENQQKVAKSRREVERKVKEARAEAIRKKELVETTSTAATEQQEVAEKQPPQTEIAPEKPHTEGTPEKPHTEGTPEKPHTEGTPEKSHTEGTPEKPHTEGTPEKPHTEGTPEKSHTEGTPEKPHTEGAPEKPHTEGTPKPKSSAAKKEEK